MGVRALLLSLIVAVNVAVTAVHCEEGVDLPGSPEKIR